MNPEAFALGAVAWLATFAVHSTLLLGIAWLFARRVGRGAHREEERWWKVALVACVLTTSGQLALGISPFTGRVDLPATVEEHTARGGSEDLGTLEPAAYTSTLDPQSAALPISTAWVPAESVAPVTTTVKRRAWVGIVLGAWGTLAFLGLATLAGSWWRLCRRLTHRTRLSPGDGAERGRLAVIFSELCVASGVRATLSASTRISSPIALGIFRREICIPTAAVHSLSADEQRAMLAHELAHAKRADPAWLLTLQVLERLFFFQPLLRVARRRQQDLAEYLCDDWAVQHTQDPLSLASCLTEVAGWVVRPRHPELAPSMAARGAELSARVERLVGRDAASRSRGSRTLVPLAVTSAVLVFLAAPLIHAAGGTDLRFEPSELLTKAKPAAPAYGEPRPETLERNFVVLLEERDTEAGPAAALQLFDAEVAMISQELALLKREAAAIDPEGRTAELITLLEGRVASLLAKRERLETLLPLLDELTNTDD